MTLERRYTYNPEDYRGREAAPSRIPQITPRVPAYSQGFPYGASEAVTAPFAQPTPYPWLQRMIPEPVAKGMGIAFAPFTMTGMGLKETMTGGWSERQQELREQWVEELKALGEITPENLPQRQALRKKYETQIQALEPEAERERIESYEAQPLWQRLLWESPAFAGLAKSGISALRGVRALETMPGTAPRVARVALETTGLPTIERATGLVVGKTVEMVYRGTMTPLLRHHLRTWAKEVGIEIPKATEDTFVQATIRELRPSFVAKENIKLFFKPIKGGYQFTPAGSEAAEAAAREAIRKSPLLAGRVARPAPSVGAVEVATGQPTALTVFRGTPKIGGVPYQAWGSGTYYTTSRAIAGRYAAGQPNSELVGAELNAAIQEAGGKIESRELQIRNPYVISETPEDAYLRGVVSRAEKAGKDPAEAIPEALKKRGYDALIIKRDEGYLEVIPYAEAVPVAPAVKPKPPSAPPTLRIVSNIKQMHADTQKRITSLKEQLKGKRGREATAGRQSLKLLEQEIKNLDQLLKGLETMAPTKGALRQQIMGIVKFKGITEKEFRDTMLSKFGITALRSMTPNQLTQALRVVTDLRPKKIKNVVILRPQTENSIASLRDKMIQDGKLTEEVYENLLTYLKLSTDRYVSGSLFISNQEGKQLIRLMNQQAEVGIIEYENKVAEALARKPTVAGEIEKLNKRQAKQTEVYVNGKPVGVSFGWDMRLWVEKLQVRTRGEFPARDIWQPARDKRLVADFITDEKFEKLRDEVPGFEKAMADPEAATRIENYIAAKWEMANIESPVDITAEEVGVAKAIEDVFAGYQNEERFQRFKTFYYQHEGNIDNLSKEIPNAPREDLIEAVRIYESRGEEALRRFTDTKTWGVIKEGYVYRTVVKPGLRLTQTRMTTLSKGFLHTRSGLDFLPTDTSIFQRLRTYIKNMETLKVEPYLREMDRALGDTQHFFANPSGVGSDLTLAMNEMKGFIDEGGKLGKVMARVVAQAYAAIFWNPWLSYRNLHQLLAYYPNRTDLINPLNRKLTDQEMRYWEIFVRQSKAMATDWMLRTEKPLPGLATITKIANRTSLYGKSDDADRLVGFWGALNHAERAVKEFRKSGDIGKFMRNSGVQYLSTEQQKQVLKMMALDEYTYPEGSGLEALKGDDAAARYIAEEICNYTFYLYSRFQRSIVEMGGMGRSLGSLLTFPRSTAQRFIIQLEKANPWGEAPTSEMVRAWKWAIGELAFSMLAGWAYVTATGKTRHPYNLLNVVSWQAGGLTIGAAQQLTDLFAEITRAAQGDADALGRLPAALTTAADMFVPFYQVTLNILESWQGQKYWDRKQLRKVIELIKDNYKINESFYEQEREISDMLRHAIFGGEVKEEDKGKAKPLPGNYRYSPGDYRRK